jgi:hypothetical protein
LLPGAVLVGGFRHLWFNDFKLVHGDCPFGSAALFFAGMSPMDVSLVLTTTDSKGEWVLRLLMNEQLRCLTAGSPIYCSDHLHRRARFLDFF